MKPIRYVVEISVKDRETQFEFAQGSVVTAVQIIDQENPCVFVRYKWMEKDQSVPVSLDVFKLAFRRLA